MMNAKTGKLMTLVAVVLTSCLGSLEQLALARSPRGFLGPGGNSAQSTSSQSANSNCKKLRGIRIDVFDPAAGIASGTITRGGILNGTTEDVINFGAGVAFTPDPSMLTLTYLSDLTITTVHGELKASTVILSTVTGDFFTQMANINPATSTGRFAGATGVIFLSGKAVGDPFNRPLRIGNCR